MNHRRPITVNLVNPDSLWYVFSRELTHSFPTTPQSTSTSEDEIEESYHGSIFHNTISSQSTRDTLSQSPISTRSASSSELYWDPSTDDDYRSEWRVTGISEPTTPVPQNAREAPSAVESDLEPESELIRTVCRQAVTDATTLLNLLQSEIPVRPVIGITHPDRCVHQPNARKRCFMCAIPNPLIGLQNKSLHQHQHIFGPRRKRARLRLVTTTSALADPSSTSGRTVPLPSQSIRAMLEKRMIQSRARALGFDGLPPNRWIGNGLLDGAIPYQSLRLALGYLSVARPSMLKATLIEATRKAAVGRPGPDLEELEFVRWWKHLS